MMETRANTPLFFQEALKKEVEQLTTGMLFHNPKSGELVPLSVHKQALPIPQRKDLPPNSDIESIDYLDGEEEEAVFKCPWCIIKIDSGNIPGINENQEINVAVCFGIFNDSVDNQGHEEILNLIQKVYARFAVDSILAGQYVCQGKFQWGLQDEDTFPYFYGAIGMDFKLQGFRRENKFM